MDSDQEDSEEKRYTPDAIGETPGMSLIDEDFCSPVVIFAIVFSHCFFYFFI